MKKIISLLSIALIATNLSAMQSDTTAYISNKSSYAVKEIRFKVKINGKKYSITIDEAIAPGSPAQIDLSQAAPDVDAIESLEIIKVRPKFCIDQNGTEKKCRARIRPENGSQRNFIITDEKAGVFKSARDTTSKKGGKKVKPALQKEPRLVRVEYSDDNN